MAIALYGGSFDPPHEGHVAVVEAALSLLPINALYVVPAFVNPFKSGTHAPAERRLAWLKAIFKKTDGVFVDDFELEQGRPVPTVETVRHFRQHDPDIYLIIGSDNLESLHRWHRFEELDAMVTWVVATRKGYATNEKYLRLDVDVDISSTELRNRLKTDRIPETVRQEIAKHYHKETECKKD